MKKYLGWKANIAVYIRKSESKIENFHSDANLDNIFIEIAKYQKVSMK